MTYATQFPTFPAADLPAFVLSEGWTDHSWSKEACPFFIHEATGLGIWTGGSVREPDMGARFVVVRMVASADGWQHGDSEPLYSGDSEAEALDALIGEAFAADIADIFTDAELAETRARNATPDYAAACATHDFCDANEPMAAAFAAIMGRPVDADADAAIWSSAWDYAKATHLTAAKAG
jgi:hypothetical protein